MSRHVVTLFASLLYTSPRFRCLFLPLTTFSGSAFLRYFFHDRRSQVNGEQPRRLKKIHVPSRIPRWDCSFYCVSRFVSIGPWQNPGVPLSIRFIIYLHFLRSAGTMLALIALIYRRMCKYSGDGIKRSTTPFESDVSQPSNGRLLNLSAIRAY